MKTKSKTFQEGEDIHEAMIWSQGYIWDNNVEIVDKGGYEEYFLKHKIQIIIKLFTNDI